MSEAKKDPLGELRETIETALLILKRAKNGDDGPR
jgi:hypothetical protein